MGCHHPIMKILIATKNHGKFEEIREMLGGLKAEFVSLEEVGTYEDFPEHGDSFEENALGKARFYSALWAQTAANAAVVADDSGIFVEALGDELGLKTRRWGAGHEASDEEWLAHFFGGKAEE